MALAYRSGVEAKQGDRVRLHGEPGVVELVATDEANPDESWYVTPYGGGVMIAEPKVFGRLFISANELSTYEDLEFVSRVEDENQESSREDQT